MIEEGLGWELHVQFVCLREAEEGAEGKCAECRAEWAKRPKVLTNADALPAELRRHPFRAAPGLYVFNVARYFARSRRRCRQ